MLGIEIFIVGLIALYYARVRYIKKMNDIQHEAQQQESYNQLEKELRDKINKALEKFERDLEKKAEKYQAGEQLENQPGLTESLTQKGERNDIPTHLPGRDNKRGAEYDLGLNDSLTQSLIEEIKNSLIEYIDSKLPPEKIHQEVDRQKEKLILGNEDKGSKMPDPKILDDMKNSQVKRKRANSSATPDKANNKRSGISISSVRLKKT
ncbi:hypothetical protein [Abyssalbus ytuae]|uniref:Uncharacterized protein n=1 Tax=Abyssalbus ytuae TaxID=2926907 RepID=A0A9E6ZQH0_9FLAO|nr:hypothetical protein [Abyssalbus ytuae]UOB16908.1 hypothetical protein MQE35_14350 [Abyssalbus ytuae]